MAHLSGRPGVHRGVPAGRRHPPADGGAHLQRAGGAGDAATCGPGRRRSTSPRSTGRAPFALSRQLGISQEEARTFIARYFERFAGVRAFLDRQIELAREQGYVETLFKRRRYIPEIRDRNFNMRAYGERNAQNSPLQGSAADLIKLAMIRIHRAIREEGLRSRMLLQVHDELVFEVPPDEVERMRALVCDHMEGVVQLDVPLVVDIGVGDNWLDAKH